MAVDEPEGSPILSLAGPAASTRFQSLFSTPTHVFACRQLRVKLRTTRAADIALYTKTRTQIYACVYAYFRVFDFSGLQLPPQLIGNLHIGCVGQALGFVFVKLEV